jgi:hypothetical protein
MARRNGWQAPYAIQFIALNVIFYLSALAFFGYFQFLIDPSLLDPLSPPVLPWGPMRIAILTITIISLLMSYSASLYASIKNPADPAILRKHHNSTSTDSESCSKFCEICDCAVHDGTMHCKYCDKCILRLDHHCFYLNTCIGRRNYSAYLISIGTGCVYFACISICGWFSFAAYFTNRQRLIDIGIYSIFCGT